MSSATSFIQTQFLSNFQVEKSENPGTWGQCTQIYLQMRKMFFHYLLPIIYFSEITDNNFSLKGNMSESLSKAVNAEPIINLQKLD